MWLEADDIYIPPYTAQALFEADGRETEWLKELRQEIFDKGLKVD